MDQIKLLKKRNDLSRFISLLEEDSLEKLENYLIESNFEVDIPESTEDENSLTESLLLDSFSLSEEDQGLLTEEVKTNIKTIFDAVVNEKVNNETSKIERNVQEFITESQNSVDEYALYVKTELEKENENYLEQLNESLNEYLSLIVEEWVKENEIAIEDGVKQGISNSLLTGLKQLFESNYIDVPTEEISLIGELETKASELDKQNKVLTEEVANIKKRFIKAQKQLIVEEFSNGLSDLDKDKLKTLCESISASNFDEYKTKVGILKKKFITEEKEVKGTKDTSDVLLESIEEGVKPVLDENDGIDPKTKSYIEFFNRSTKK